MDIQYLGNEELLKLPKTAFLASSTIPPDMVLKCYDWAMAKHEGCIVSGFSSLYPLKEKYQNISLEHTGTL